MPCLGTHKGWVVEVVASPQIPSSSHVSGRREILGSSRGATKATRRWVTLSSVRLGDLQS